MEPDGLHILSVNLWLMFLDENIELKRYLKIKDPQSNLKKISSHNRKMAWVFKRGNHILVINGEIHRKL